MPSRFLSLSLLTLLAGGACVPLDELEVPQVLRVTTSADNPLINQLDTEAWNGEVLLLAYGVQGVNEEKGIFVGGSGVEALGCPSDRDPALYAEREGEMALPLTAPSGSLILAEPRNGETVWISIRDAEDCESVGGWFWVHQGGRDFEEEQDEE